MSLNPFFNVKRAFSVTDNNDTSSQVCILLKFDSGGMSDRWVSPVQ
jgi:hypothetical protein